MLIDGESRSPGGGRYQVRTDLWEARNSLWVETPEIREYKTAKTLLHFESNLWSLDECDWESPSRVRLALRKFPGGHTPTQIVATVDCEAGTAVVGANAAVPLASLETLLEAQLTWR